MFIREVKKKNKGSEKKYVYHRLMESYRTDAGPRQRMILNLGKLDIPREEWKLLADRIEELITGTGSLFSLPDHLEQLALHYARLLNKKVIKEDSVEKDQQRSEDLETIDLNTFSTTESRTLGAEAIAYEAYKRLQFPELFKELGFNKWQANTAALSIIGRAVNPASERKTTLWAKKITALSELLETDFEHLSNNALYRISDRLYNCKKDIETYLHTQENKLYGGESKFILYDLTNTYFTGRCTKSTKAKRGVSKEKRYDRPLLTLALVLDETGFPRVSEIYPGNVGESTTLEAILDNLLELSSKQGLLFESRPTVVMDAGIVTNDNLRLIRSKKYDFEYICVSRHAGEIIPEEELLVIKSKGKSTIKAMLKENGEEMLLYCRSSDREKKEAAMKSLFRKRFEEGLENIVVSLKKKCGTKKFEKVMERIGRLRGKFSRISRFYTIDVEKDKDKATKITWSFDDKKAEIAFAGTYYLRTSRKDLSEKEIWSIYSMLLHVEDAFRCLKSDLGLRPGFHQVDRRMEGHLFISVLAYHLVTVIQKELHKAGIRHRWGTIKELMSTQTRITTSFKNKQGKKIGIRSTVEPEEFHFQVLKAMQLPLKPLGMKKFIL